MRGCTPAFVCALILIGVCHAACSAATRLAILPGEGERAPAEVVVAQVEAGMTGEKEISLVERAEIRRILAEQKLSAAGLADPATAVKLGHLLSADLFLFMERVPKSQPTVCRAQVIEARTGMVLAGELMEEKGIGEGADGVKAVLAQGIQKRAMPLGERRYVGVLGLRNEEPGQSLDGLARTLWMLLVNDLPKSPEVILLDREHLQWLRQERELTDAELALKLSTVLVDGGVRRSPENGKVDLTLLLTPLAGGGAERVTLRFDPKEMESARKEILAAVAGKLKLQAPALAVVGGAEKEGRRFLAQSRMMMVCGEKDAALRAAEAAYALWPERSTRLGLALCCSDRVLQYWQRPNDVGYSSDISRFEAATEDAQSVSLQFERQMLTLFLRQYELDLAPAGEPLPQDQEGRDLRVRVLPGLGVITHDAKGRAAELQPEVAALRRALFDVVASAAGRDRAKYGGLYDYALQSATYNLSSRHFQHADAKAKGWAEIFDRWRANRNEKGEVSSRFAGFLLVNITSLQRLRHGDALDDRARFDAALRPFTIDGDPLVRFVANYALCVIHPDDTASAEGALKFIRDEIRWADFTRGAEGGIAGAANWAFRAFGEKNPELTVQYCEQILGPWMKEGGDTWRVGDWYMSVHEWAKAAQRVGGKEQADAVYARVIAALQDSLKRWPKYSPTTVRHYKRDFEEARIKLGVAAPPAPAPDDPWKRYEVRALGLNLPARADAVVVRGDKLYCVLRTCERPEEGIVTISIHRFPAGGAAERTVSLTIPARARTQGWSTRGQRS